jgi:hypothetical protein
MYVKKFIEAQLQLFDALTFILFYFILYKTGERCTLKIAMAIARQRSSEASSDVLNY